MLQNSDLSMGILVKEASTISEALKDCLRQKEASINEIYRYAKVCRVSNVIRPYMEAL
jgi:hypothetical protein